MDDRVDDVDTVQLHSMSTEIDRNDSLSHGTDTDDNMVSISMKTFRRLCNDSIELLKAQKEIQKLKKSTEKLNDEIQKYKKKFSSLSPVSARNLLSIYFQFT